MPSGAIKTWTPERIEGELRATAATLGHFPAASELRSIGRNDLCCAVTKAGGLLAWSDRLGLPRVHSDSDTGWDGERAFVSACESQGLPATRGTSVKAPFDVLVGDAVRVDVKAARFAEYRSGGRLHGGWWYRLGKVPQADVVVFWQLDTGAFYGLPWWMCPTSNISICKSGGQYAKYLNNWSWIRHLVMTRKAEMESVA